MKATGIVRRFDDLGRIVIPKEIRKIMFGTWENTGQPVEIFMDKESIVLRKYEEKSKDDVCEWKIEETTGVVWHCDDECTIYNPAYAKNLKIILEDFECKCPNCGKKIKVVV